MRLLTREQVHVLKVQELGLDPSSINLESVEGISGAIRRAAGQLCPCSWATLVNSVVSPLREIVNDLNLARERVEETLEAMVAHGDLLELADQAGDPQGSPILVYPAPPSFVQRENGNVILLGISAEQISPLPAELEQRIEYRGHTRTIAPKNEEELSSDLLEIGLHQLSDASWMKAPKVVPALDCLASYDRLLDAQSPSREIPGLQLLDPTKPTTYYKGRWTEPKQHTGRFVARRKQAYGADLWCYVSMKGGRPDRMVDLPQRGTRWRGCDEAWYLQMAIDMQRGEPQQYRVVGSGIEALMEFFSPVPSWARRRWDALGEAVPGKGRLFAYRIPGAELQEERRYIREALWLSECSA